MLVEQSINVAATVARRAVFMERGAVAFEGLTEDLIEEADRTERGRQSLARLLEG